MFIDSKLEHKNSAPNDSKHYFSLEITSDNNLPILMNSYKVIRL
jgi:hypothetical protein